MTPADTPHPIAAMRLVVPALQFSALIFGLAGLWLLWQPPAALGGETAGWLGLALLLAAGGDLVAAEFLRRRFLESTDRPKA